MEENDDILYNKNSLLIKVFRFGGFLKDILSWKKKVLPQNLPDLPIAISKIFQVNISA